MNYERQYVWSILFRLFHWALALSIVVLAITGFYIHDPWTNSVLEGGGRFPMATMRYIHFVAGFVFTAALIVRLYLFLFGNRHERILSAAPVTGRNIKNLFTTLAYYSYATDRHEHRLGHNAVAGTVYLITYFFVIGQMLTGFYMLYPESATWQSIGGPLFGIQQQARFIHYLIMWYMFIFVAIHLYLLIWNDIKSPEGMISSIFTGNKFKPKHDRA
ncbi:MAG: Ni/Fe-hydrogenase, b-type cytochrome subunit [Desulfobulbaceae bacterium]|nr:Ni/Fe-hydrogenase, b-type cytochrome subunit [Desulfobulbaceae bacterium]